MGPGVAQWLRHCATSRAVPGSNPGVFSRIPTEPCALGSTQPLKMSTRDSPGGKGGRCVRLTTYHPCSAERQEIRCLNLPRPPWAISTACCGRDLYLLHWVVPWWLVAGLSMRRPEFHPRPVHRTWLTKWHWNGVLSEYFGFHLSVPVSTTEAT